MEVVEIGAHRADVSLDKYRRANEDIFDGLKRVHMWLFLAWQEIRARYKRSTIGPFWISLNMAIMVFTMGPLYSRLFRQDLNAYYVYLASSVVIWGLIQAIINESCMVFISAEGFIKQIKLPFSVFVYKSVWKNVIIFLHNFVVVLLVFLIFTPNFGWGVLLFPVGLLLVCLNGVWAGLVLGLICTRFRDIPQIVTSFMGVAFFITPVMWQVSMLGNRAWIMNLNPFYHFMEVVRSPLISSEINYESFGIVIAITIFGYFLTLALFARFRARISYWL